MAGQVMTEPQRIQRQRTKGWRMPEGAVYVGRPGRWGNPFLIGQPIPDCIGGRSGLINAYAGIYIDGVSLLTPSRLVEDAMHAVALYYYWVIMTVPFTRATAMQELARKDLACWCPAAGPCHADLLLELANQPLPVFNDSANTRDSGRT